MATLAEKFSKKPQTLAEKFAPKAPEPVANPYNAPFRAVPGENPLLAGVKAVGNLPTSAFGFGKGIVESALHPIDTAKSLANMAIGAEQKGLNKVFGQNVQTPQTQNFDVLTQALKQRYGSLDNLQKTATEDPFGFGADVLSVLQGGAGVLGKTEQLNNALSKTAQIVTKPVTSTISKAGQLTGSTARFGVSQATGLNPETINEIVKNPQKFKEMNPELRMQTAQQVADTLDTRLSELSDVGKEYQAIRQFDVPVNIPQDTVSKVLSKYGVKLDEAGKIITSPESRPLSAVDRTALQDFITNYGSEKELTSNSFLNTREALSNLSRYEQGKTTLPTQIARDLRQEYDALGKAQIPGLANLDAVFAPEKQLLSQLKKDILTPAGELKDGAISKIANITGKGKEKLLERMKEIVPDIEDRVRVIKAVEDIERASGFKTGTYIRGALVGGGALTGNVPAIIGAILSQPEIAVPLLKGAGYVGQKARPILEAIKTIANDVNNFTVPKPVLNYVDNPKMGLSVENIAKNIHPEDQKLMTKFIDSVRIGEKLSDSEFSMVEKLAQRFGISMDSGLSKVANSFEDILGGVKKVKGTAITGRPFSGESSLIQEAKKYKSAEEFVKAQKTGDIKSGTYDSTVKSLSESSILSKENNPIVVGKIGKYEIRESGKLNKYVKTDVNGEVIRNGKDVVYLTPEEIKSKNLPEKDTSLVVFDEDKPVGYVMDSFGSPEISVAKEYQRQGIGSELLKRWMQKFPNKKIGQMTPEGEALVKSQLTDIWKKANKK